MDMRNNQYISYQLPWGGDLVSNTLYFSYSFYNLIDYTKFKKLFS